MKKKSRSFRKKQAKKKGELEQKRKRKNKRDTHLRKLREKKAAKMAERGEDTPSATDVKEDVDEKEI